MNSDENQTPEKVEESKLPRSRTEDPAWDSSVFEEEQSSTVEEEQEPIELEKQSSEAEDLEEDASVQFLFDFAEDFPAESPQELDSTQVEQAIATVADLQRQEQDLRQEIATLQTTHSALSNQLAETQSTMGRLVQEALAQLEQRKQALTISVEQLERRQERIRAEMRTTFAGTSQDLAIRVQGFKDYLTGSLQDLAAAAEQLELAPKVKEKEKEEPIIKQSKPARSVEAPSSMPQFAEQQFQSTGKQIRRLLDQYRSKPDYYGPPWQLRRTFEPVHEQRVSNWFFTMGGRGALRTMGSRLQNILIGSAISSVLNTLYGDRVRTLILANTPERLGEWRRGLQDCLGISRSDFGPDRGVTLFESADALALKADRLLKADELPLIIVDDSEDTISLSILQFPIWLAFAPDPQAPSRDRDSGYEW